MENNEIIIPKSISNLLSNYVEKFAELVSLEAKVRLLKAQFKDDRDWVRATEAAAIFGWDDLPKREEKEEEVSA